MATSQPAWDISSQTYQRRHAPRSLPSPLWGGSDRRSGAGSCNLRARQTSKEYPSLLLRSLPPHKGEGRENRASLGPRDGRDPEIRATLLRALRNNLLAADHQPQAKIAHLAAGKEARTAATRFAALTALLWC